VGHSAFCLQVDLERHAKFWNSYWGDIRVMFVIMDVAGSHGSRCSLFGLECRNRVDENLKKRRNCCGIPGTMQIAISIYESGRHEKGRAFECCGKEEEAKKQTMKKWG
jgi:hypothetical protein